MLSTAALESKNEAEKQYELQILQYIINQLHQSEDQEEVANVLRMLEAKETDLVILRTKILEIYEQENMNNGRYSILFYNALFSFLLLLAKHAPLDADPMDREDNRPQVTCSISGETIQDHFRVLATHGYQFDGSNSGFWQWININGKYPTYPRTSLDARERTYLATRQSVIGSNNVPLSTVPEIPDPRNLSSPVSIRPDRLYHANLGVYLGTIIALLCLPFAMGTAFPIVALFAICVAGGGILGFFKPELHKLAISIKNCVSPPAPIAHDPIAIDARTPHIYSRITANRKTSSEANSSAQAAIGSIDATQDARIAHTQALSELDDEKRSDRQSDNPREPLIPRNPQPQRVSQLRTNFCNQIEADSASAIAEKKARTYGATDHSSQPQNFCRGVA